ncbi:hypothetical protein SLEP1_g53288 [Rubroshorea leprosula]|uniref:Uncharacterized protein n=1 Tax=Rubroshorea leprosula TaxID=152421 RepID=A0AAV5M8Y9_9ROSI|nr:hypothetical protein SLEP1_g53288 [Rubroshorea leprosula]
MSKEKIPLFPIALRASHKEISFQPLSCSAMNPWPDLCKEVYQLSRDEGNTG